MKATMVVGLTMLLVRGALGAELEAVANEPTPLEAQGRASVARAATWLLDLQNEEGHWSTAEFPAITALAAWALAWSEVDTGESLKRAAAYLLSCQVHEGHYSGAIFKRKEGIRHGGLPNYNTALSIIALAEIDGAAFTSAILKGREFMQRSQRLGAPDDIFLGGMGYDTPHGRVYADMSNSYIAFEAMHRTRRFEEFRPANEQRVDLDWTAALQFIQRCHNDPSFNDLPWTTKTESERGGFVYRPDEFRESSGSFEENGVVRFRSMPGMTYAGLLSYIYAGLDRSDPRVLATVRWAGNHWNLDKGNRNPDVAGTLQELEGLYYMFNVMSKGLDVFGRDTLIRDDGTRIEWRRELIEDLVKRQSEEGYWINANGRYMESDSVLVTAYTMIALQHALGMDR